MKRLAQVCIATQVFAIILLVVINFSGPFFILNETQLQSVGQVFSSLDIALGLAAYYQAGKGKPQGSLLLAPSLFGPLFYSLGGAFQTVIFYQVIAMVIQILALYRFYKRSI